MLAHLELRDSGRLLDQRSPVERFGREYLADAPLLHCGLLLADGGERPAQAPLFRVADGVVRRLLGRAGVDIRLARVLLDDGAPALVHGLWDARAERHALAALLLLLLLSEGLLVQR